MPPSPEQIEAAAKAAYEWDNDDPECVTFAWESLGDGTKGWYREIVGVALAAAEASTRFIVEDESDDEFMRYRVRDTHSGRTVCSHSLRRDAVESGHK